jgi:phytoene/squalene synthetase
MSDYRYIDSFNNIDFNKIIDHPNILIAANFWEKDRYLAARTCYKFMRDIDDLVDNHKSLKKEFSTTEKAWLQFQVNSWLNNIKNDLPVADEKDENLIQTIKNFNIPVWALEDFANSMLYDIQNDGFKSLATFLEYSNGASVAPSSIFVHLCGLTQSNGRFEDPVFDVREAAKPCAYFSYIVHIIRDFQKDQSANLSYFADDLIQKHDLTRDHLKSISMGAPIPSGFREMIREYLELAEKFRQKTEEVIERISPLLEPRYRLSLHIIYQLYLMVYNRIDLKKGKFTGEELNPTAQEIKEKVYQTILKFA